MNAVRSEGRRFLIGGQDTIEPALRPILMLAGFAGMAQASVYALLLFEPEITHSLGISGAVYGIVVAQQQQGFIFAAVQLSAVLHRRPEQRARLAVVSAAGCVVAMVGAAFATNWLALLGAAGLLGGAMGATYAVHRPLLLDLAPPGSRVRALTLHQGGMAAGTTISASALVIAGHGLGLSWRGVFLALGMVCLAGCVAGWRLRDPGYGQHDTDRLRDAVRREVASPLPASTGDELGLGFVEVLRRAWLVPTVRRLLAGWAVLGAVLTPLVSHQFTLLSQRWHLGVTGRAAFLAVASAFALPALVGLARWGDRAFLADPGRLVRAGAAALVVMAVGLVVAGGAPWVGVSLLGFATVLTTAALLVPVLTLPMLTVVRPRMRAPVAALAAVFFAGVGAEAGSFLLGGVAARYGAGAAVAVLALPALAAAHVLRNAARDIAADVDRLVEELVEQEEVDDVVARGGHVPLLACRHIDFSYGGLQVLFDVDFTVDDGELVALLGTNGAGKSTLLRVISGLGLPSRGSVQLRGHDVTFLDAERRTPLGVTQVPGGHAVFGPMSVVDNLRVFAYGHGRDRRAVERGIDAAFVAFPRLAERRNQLASTLSGGEQQMLGVSRAMVVEPSLLLIDELSLGLAPKVIAELLDAVRGINRRGTAVVLVEQSVNIALSIADHAYFMEKGAIRFDGRSSDLLERPDLLRSIFLDGAAR